MSLFLVTYTHPDSPLWQQHLMAHVHFLQDMLAAGTLRASGPIPGASKKMAVLIVAAESETAARALLANDPYMLVGIVEDMTVTPWDPIFGVFNADSTMPGRMQTRDT